MSQLLSSFYFFMNTIVQFVMFCNGNQLVNRLVDKFICVKTVFAITNT
jgi:hypothetical protein